MPHTTGTRLGGIVTLRDLRGRCVIDADTACWHLRTPRGRAMPRDRVHKVWLYGSGQVSATRAAWALAGNAEPQGDQRVYRCCTGYDCVNPAHLVCMAPLDWGREVAARGTRRGARAARASFAARESGAVITAELADWARHSGQRAADVAHALGVCKYHIHAIRRGEHWLPAPRGASVFASVAGRPSRPAPAASHLTGPSA